VKQGALTQHPRPAYFDAMMDAMGYSLRTDRYRYIEWRDPTSGEVLARELYDHKQDPDETSNIADAQQTIVKDLARKLEMTIRGNRVDHGK
jgi:iduronate 2-sulfatase